MIAFLSFQGESYAKDQPVRVILNDKTVTFDQEPVIVNGRTLVPFRAIFEALDIPIKWDQATRTVVGEKDGAKIKLTIDSPTAYVNNEAIVLDVPAQLVNSRTLVPLRFFENAGLHIGWNQQSQTVTMEGQVQSPDEKSVDTEELGQQLLHEVLNHNFDKALKLVHEGADVNYSGSFRNTSLQHAALNNHYELTELLLENGADANHILDLNSRYTILASLINMKDSEKPDLAIFELLLKHGADPNHKLSSLFNSYSMLTLASQKTYHVDGTNVVPSRQLIELLLKYGANPMDHHALYEAVNAEAYDVVKLYLDNGVSPNVLVEVTGDHHTTPLITALGKRDKELIKLLLDYGADKEFYDAYLFVPNAEISKFLNEY